MMIAVRDNTKHLFQLIHAVRRHNPGKLIQEIGQPSQKTDNECRSQRMHSKRIPAFDRFSFAEEFFHLLHLHNPKEQKFE